MTERQIYLAARAELERCEARAAELRSFVRLYEELAGFESDQPKPGAPKRRPTEPQDWERMAEDALRESGRPMTAPELYAALSAQGFAIDSNNPSGVLGTRLTRSLRFEKVGRGLFDVAADVKPPAATPANTVSASGVEDDDDEDGATSRRGVQGPLNPEDIWEHAAKGG